MSPDLTRTALQHLRRACTRTDGRLPERISPRLLRTLLEGGYAYRNDPDGYRLAPAEALRADGPAHITPQGRYAALNAAEQQALTRAVAPDGRLAPSVLPATGHTLVRLRLAEWGDAPVRPAPSLVGPARMTPARIPVLVRTSLGAEVAQAAPLDHPARPSQTEEAR